MCRVKALEDSDYARSRFAKGEVASARIVSGSIARPIAMFGMGVLIGCITATGWLLRWQAGSRAVLGAGGGACVLLIRGDPSAGERGFSSTALMVDVDTGKRLGSVRVLSDAKLENRSSVRAVCRVKALDDSDYARSRFAKGEVASARIVSILEQGTEARGVSIGSLRARALRVLDAGGSDYRALVAGTVCGRTTELNQSEAQADFSACGLTHLVARARALRVLDAGGSDYRALVAGTVCGRTTELNQSEAQADFSACGLTHLVAVSGSHFAIAMRTARSRPSRTSCA